MKQNSDVSSKYEANLRHVNVNESTNNISYKNDHPFIEDYNMQNFSPLGRQVKLKPQQV